MRACKCGVINHIASSVNLAKSWRMSIDRTKVETSMPTATLFLLLDALIEVGEDRSGAGAKTADIQAKVVIGRSAALQAAIKDRDE